MTIFYKFSRKFRDNHFHKNNILIIDQIVIWKVLSIDLFGEITFQNFRGPFHDDVINRLIFMIKGRTKI